MATPMFGTLEFIRGSWRRILVVLAGCCCLVAVATYVFLSIGAPVEVIAGYAILVHAVAMMQIMHPGAGITIDRRGPHWHSPPRRSTGPR